jgi:eukaryotic-like serine/threonine-protein kinase
MDSERWTRLTALFHATLALPEAERAAYVLRTASDDPGLADEVLALLAEDAHPVEVLDRSLAAVANDVLEGGAARRTERIGPYRVLRVLGHGGSGVVYLAERPDLRSRAAIKVLRDAWVSPERRERFTREQQTLAQLNHPSIARLYDAGTLPDGTPYLVMEYVPGKSLMEHCAEHRCGLGERLRLFRAVCEAVRHAHRYAVIHRDLKPSNVLVTEPAGREPAAVKLVDFGIAKQVAGLDRALETRDGLRPLTPAYAAPEQLRGEPVGVYTDVHALGLLLYELLTGVHPFVDDLADPARLQAAMLEREPTPPSQIARRGSDAGAVMSRRAWADLDVVCLTALQKDPQRRYSTVEALVRDLDHFERREPLEARSASVGYRIGKFLARNREKAVAAALLAVLVLSGAATHTSRLAAARDAAELEATRAHRIQQFMLGLLQGGGAGEGPADTLRVIAVLEQGAREAGLLQAEPAVQAELYQTLGSLFQGLGELERADSLLHLSLERRLAVFGDGHPDLARGMTALALLRTEQGKLDEAEYLARDAVLTARRGGGAAQAHLATAMTALGKVLQQRGDYDQAVQVLEDAVRIRVVRDAGSAELSNTLTQLANTHFYAGNYAASDSINRIALMIDRELHGDRHPTIADGLINLGAARHQLGDLDASEQLYREALEIKRDYHGPDDHRTAAVMMMLGQILTHQERYDEALALLPRALTVRERVYGPDHPRVANVLNELGSLALRTGELGTADEHFTRMAGIYRRAYGDDHYLVAIALSNLGSVAAEAGDLTLAEARLSQAVDGFQAALSAEHVNTAIARVKLGEVLVRQGRLAEAKQSLLQGHAVLEAQLEPSAAWLKRAREQLLAVHESLGDAEGAERFRTAAHD